MPTRLEDQRAGHCRHCGARLPLIKRVKREEFCSDEHREKFLNSNHAAALGRLQENGPAHSNGPELARPEKTSWHAGPLAQSQNHPDQPQARFADPLAPAPETAVAVEEFPPDPSDPPMAGTMRPAAVNAPLRLSSFFDGDENRLGQWEPVRPEPQWHSIALHFDLAEFYPEAPEPFTEPGSELARPLPEGVPAEPHPALAMPQNDVEIRPTREERAAELAQAELAEAELAAAELAEAEASRAPAPLAGPSPQGNSFPAAPRARSSVPVPEALEIDSTLYLPAFSPRSEAESLGSGAWEVASWLGSAETLEGSAGLDGKHLTQIEGTCLPIDAQIALALPLESACRIEPASLAPTAALDEEISPAEASAVQPGLPEFVVGVESIENFDEFGEREPVPQTDGNDSEHVEGRQMSEAGQNRVGSGGMPSLGERVASPFLYEPQPRPGTAKPRWNPATITLGTGAPAATEDWDIL